ncbi:phosphatase PAP2 family protein [Demequina oxidasica]|uniref:phosphatase PAP2 family protein n=1 Tax=Demequina oxidasica TaxID=676199 RepID=UPI000A0673B4|nr:phosphatase PAP2 family protein [Demequina oxidasica]
MLGPGPGTIAPTGAEVGRGLLKRVLLPSIVLWVAVAGVGFLIVDVFQLDESALSESFVDARSDQWDTVTHFISSMGNTPILMGTCAVIVLFIWWQSRMWWFAIVPAISLTVQVSIFLTTSLLIGRERPDVEQLDQAAPTSSFPSGHTGATTSVYLAVALCATRIQNVWLRVTVQIICVLIPIGMALSRVYRGMHHPTDVVVGLGIGATCAIIAWNWLPTRAPNEVAGKRSQPHTRDMEPR